MGDKEKTTSTLRTNQERAWKCYFDFEKFHIRDIKYYIFMINQNMEIILAKKTRESLMVNTIVIFIRYF